MSPRINSGEIQIHFLPTLLCRYIHNMCVVGKLGGGLDPQVKFEQVSSDDHQMSVARGKGGGG